MNQQPTQSRARLTLLCGRCPTRRILCRLSLWPERFIDGGLVPGPVVVLVDRKRPSVKARPTADRIAAGEAPELRCRLGHPWTLPQERLVPAFQRAVAARRSEIIAGIDL